MTVNAPSAYATERTVDALSSQWNVAVTRFPGMSRNTSPSNVAFVAVGTWSAQYVAMALASSAS